MIGKILIVSANDFPETLANKFEENGFSCLFSRGRLKSKELLTENQIDCLVWLYPEYDSGLASDLLTLFNDFPDIPVVPIVQNYNEDLKEEITAFFRSVDLNDDPLEIIQAVSEACSQSKTVSVTQQEPVKQDAHLHEIDFKNAVHQLLQNPDEEDQEDKSRLEILTPWIAVDENERKILRPPTDEVEKQTFLSRVKAFFSGS